MTKTHSNMKMTSSVNNLIFLFLLAFSVFIIYRYVKSLEKELSLLKNELVALKAPVDTNTLQKDPVCFDDVCMTASGVLESTLDVPLDKLEESNEDDMESVTSKDIMKIVNEINDEEKEEVLVENDTVEQADDTDATKLVEEDDIVIKKSEHSYEDDLSKKTNEELKKILKEQGKNIKGTKSELIKRIVEEA